nr:hypothetical protein BaRGS_007684 [Batillaria attramentaria]
MNGADEDLCSVYSFGVFRNPPPPAIVNLEKNKGFTVRSFNTTELQATPLCPDTHYQCPGMTLGDLANNTLLIHISLADCDLYDLDMVIHPNLVSLDVSDNHLTHVHMTSFAGHDYAFGVMIGLNFVLFMLIAAGQIFIYWSIHVNTMSASDSTKKSNDLTIARRLLTIAVSDFLCWFPIGLLGLMASNGTPIPGEVNVAMAIIVLPLNSALNPFLYTVNVILERQRRMSEERLKKRILSELASQFEMDTYDHKITEVTSEK